MVECNRVTKHYGAARGIQDISFSIPKGGLVGLLGPNGAGKTTLMKILTGFHHPQSGEVMINSFDSRNQPVDVKSSIGYLPENAPVYPEMLVKEYLLFAARTRNVPGSASRALEKAAKSVGIDNVLNRPISNLSKGYRQRVGLAQAIIHDPPILILDEPTTGLDPNQIQEIRKLISALAQEKTVIFSSHILHEVETLCQSVIILHEGSLVAHGSLKDIGTRLRGGSVISFTFGASQNHKPQELQTFLSAHLPGSWKVQEGTRVKKLSDSQKEQSFTKGTVYDWSVLVPQELSVVQALDVISPWLWDHRVVILHLDTSEGDIEDVFAILTKEGSV